MGIAKQIEVVLGTHDWVTKSYLQDLADADLFLRPADGANHIAWQLGHLICSEHQLIEAVCPGSMPALPAGFAEKHSKEVATSDDRAKFCTKAEYLRLMEEQRAGTLKALASLSDADLEKPTQGDMQSYAPTVAAAFLLQASHPMMHSGQWVIVRRKLGKPALF